MKKLLIITIALMSSIGSFASIKGTVYDDKGYLSPTKEKNPFSAPTDIQSYQVLYLPTHLRHAV